MLWFHWFDAQKDTAGGKPKIELFLLYLSLVIVLADNGAFVLHINAMERADFKEVILGPVLRGECLLWLLPVGGRGLEQGEHGTGKTALTVDVLSLFSCTLSFLSLRFNRECGERLYTLTHTTKKKKKPIARLRSYLCYM